MYCQIVRVLYSLSLWKKTFFSTDKHFWYAKGNSTEYKIREFLHLHKGKDRVVILIDTQIEYFAIFFFPKSKWSVIPPRNATNLVILSNRYLSFACRPV